MVHTYLKGYTTTMKNYIVNTWKMYLRGLQYIQTTFF